MFCTDVWVSLVVKSVGCFSRDTRAYFFAFWVYCVDVPVRALTYNFTRRWTIRIEVVKKTGYVTSAAQYGVRHKAIVGI